MMKLLRSLVFSLALLPVALLASGPIDINIADAASLEQIRGIGPAKAEAIVKYREQNGPFASVDDLVKVPGLGERTVAQIREQANVNAGASQSAR